MGIFRLSWMVWTSWPGPWLKAELILADPPVPATGTYRSRGIDSTAAWRGAGTRGTTRRASLGWAVAAPRHRVDDDDDVAALAGRVPEPAIAQALAGVGADHQQVDRPVGGGLAGARGVARADLAAPHR